MYLMEIPLHYSRSTGQSGCLRKKIQMRIQAELWDMKLEQILNQVDDFMSGAQHMHVRFFLIYKT